MARKGKDMINTKECIDCIHSDLDKQKVKLKFHCDAKSKDFIFGQYIPCNLKEQRKDGTIM